MSGTNGNGKHASAVVAERDQMMVVTRDFTADWDGEPVRLKAGLDRVGADHELVKRYPEHFRPVNGGGPFGERGVEHRAANRPVPAPQQDELRVRRERLAALDKMEVRARARLERLAALDSEVRNRPAEAERVFWSGVGELLADKQMDAEEREAKRLFDELDAGRRRNFEADLNDIAGWLDR